MTCKSSLAFNASKGTTIADLQGGRGNQDTKFEGPSPRDFILKGLLPGKKIQNASLEEKNYVCCSHIHFKVILRSVTEKEK